MIGQSQFTEVIESLRNQKKLTYTQFLDGVVSERSYRRYVNEGKPFSFEILVSLVERLNMKMRDFVIVSMNHISMKHQKEIYLAHYLDHQMYDEAETYLDETTPPYFTHVGSKILPALKKRYSYHQKKIDLYTYLHYLKSELSLDQLKKQNILDRNTIKLLLLLLEDGSFEDQVKVIPILYDVILGQRQLITHQYDIDLNALIQTLTRVIFSNDKLKLTFEDIIESLFKVALNNTRKFHLEEGFQSFFKDALLVLDVKDTLFKECFMYYIFTKRIQHPNYTFTSDHYVKKFLSLNEAKEIFNASHFSTLYFMREGYGHEK